MILSVCSVPLPLAKSEGEGNDKPRGEDENNSHNLEEDGETTSQQLPPNSETTSSEGDPMNSQVFLARPQASLSILTTGIKDPGAIQNIPSDPSTASGVFDKPSNGEGVEPQPSTILGTTSESAIALVRNIISQSVGLDSTL
jgi:hypothetical protein